jgi:hypothetical protein
MRSFIIFLAAKSGFATIHQTQNGNRSATDQAALRKNYFAIAAVLFGEADCSAAALLVASQVKSASERPK